MVPRPLKYLITGLPRTRSAWFAALLSTTGELCVHAPTPSNYEALGRVADPSAACLYPDTAISVWQDHPILVIERTAAESKAALEKWVGKDLPHWGTVWKNYNHFLDRIQSLNVLYVPYTDLDSYSRINECHSFLTGNHLPKRTWEMYHGLKIEQHLAKAQYALNPST